MNRFVMVALVAALMLPVAGIAQTDGQTAVHAPTVKIGWLDARLVIETCDEGVRTIADIRKFVDSKNVDLDAMKRELDDLRSKLEVQGSKLTNEALFELQERATTSELNLQRFSDDTNREIDARQQRMVNTISSKIGPIIEKVALDKGLDAIFVLNGERDAWINPALIVTEDVIKAYNQAYPAGPTMPAAKKP